VLGIGGGRRTPLLPDTPTIAEAALPGFALDNWGGMLAPAGTPRGIIERLNAEIVGALRDPRIAERLTSQGIEVTPSTPEEFREMMRSFALKWSGVVRAAGIRLEP
jgi:tripartite-type tricarboxylate transporter receptor subunit TctC